MHAHFLSHLGCPMRSALNPCSAVSCPGFEPAELEHADGGRGRRSNGHGTANLGLCEAQFVALWGGAWQLESQLALTVLTTTAVCRKQKSMTWPHTSNEMARVVPPCHLEILGEALAKRRIGGVSSVCVSNPSLAAPPIPFL